jgi:two-component system cell cycle sensor histidine kinase/response regulator CckA
MPGMSGREWVRQSKAIHLEMKVLYISEYTDNTIVRHGVLESETAFFQKPFTIDAFLRKVREVLDSQKQIKTDLIWREGVCKIME